MSDIPDLAAAVFPQSEARPFAASSMIDKLAVALAAAQESMPDIDKDKKAETGKYSYTYADLASILKVVRPVLAKQGLSVLQPASVPVKGSVQIHTILLHTSGQWISERLTWPVTDSSDAQKVGSGISYGRRYGYCSMVGIQPEDEDDDAQNAREQPRRGKAKARAIVDGDDELITTTDADGKPGGQKGRLIGIMREHKVPNKDFGEHIQNVYGYNGWTEIRRRDYDAIVALAQNWGASAENGEADRGVGPDGY